MTSRLQCVCTALPLLMVPIAGLADNGVLSTYMNPLGEMPIVSVGQVADGNGVLRYAVLEQDAVKIDVEVYGGCALNFRVHAAVAEDFFQSADGSDVLITAAPDDVFAQQFDVDTNSKKFGPGPVVLEVEREFIEDWLAEEGEALVDELAATAAFTEAELRTSRIGALVHFRPTFYFGCRRWAFGNTVHWQTSLSSLPIFVYYEPAPGDPPDTDDLLLPPDDPSRIPIPAAVFGTGTRIDQNAFHLVANPAKQPCGYALTGAFVTSAPTTIRYRIEDHLGSLSPEFVVEVDQTRTAYVSHEIDFSDETGEALGFTVPDGPPPEPNGLLFGDTLFSASTGDNVQGFFRVATTAPHASKSNIVSYNLHDCTSEALAPPPVYQAYFVADPDELDELVRVYHERAYQEGKRPEVYPRN